MRLRSITKHVKEQNWFAVGLDFFIVVLGVFVGLQVSDWSAARNTDKQSELFTKRLTADLLEEAFNYQFLVEYYGDVLINANKALSILEGKSSGSDEALLISAYRATQYNEAYPRRATYDELLSTGTIGLIRDQALRDTAMRVYTVTIFEKFIQEGEFSRYREAFRMAVPVEVQNAITEQCGDRVFDIGDFSAIEDILDYECTSGLLPDQLASAANDLRSNKSILPLLRLRILNMQSVLTNLTLSNPEIRQGLQAVVDSTLERSR